MASMRKMRGKWYIRIFYNGKEKIVPTYTTIKRDAEIILRKYQQNEQDIKFNLAHNLLDQELTIDDCIKFFKQNYRTEKGIEQSTMSMYNLALRDFQNCFSYLSNFYAIKKPDYPALVEYLSSRYNKTTVNIRLRGIRAFLNYLDDKDFIKNIPFIVKQVKTDKQEPKLITPPELTNIYSFVDDSILLSIFKVYEVTGMRLGELSNSFREGDFIVILKSKSRKKRYIPIPENYHEDYDIAVNSEYLPDRITRSFTKYCKMAKVHGKTLHCLRHTFAYKKLLETNNMQLVRDLLGHASVSVTEIYTQMPMEYLLQVFGKSKSQQMELKATA